MKQVSYVIALGLMVAIGLNTVKGQELASTGYNPNSIHPIHESDIMFRKTIWRRMDLTEKQNRSFFAFNNEITKIIIEAVKAGILHPYMNDSLKTRMSKEQFLQNLKLPLADAGLTEEEKAMGFTEEGNGWGDASGWGDAAEGTATETEEEEEEIVNEFFPNEVSILEIKEDMIFDKKRSRMYFDIKSIKLIIPAEKFETGLYRKVGVFRYKDLAELFRSMPEQAIWFNPQNSAQHLNLADAFELRLFDARIIKVANPRNLQIIDMYSGSAKEGLLKSKQIEMQLLEFEHNLWEF